MIEFPNITKPAYPMEEEYENTSVTSKFEDGSMQTRSKFTRSRRKWTLKWGYLSEAEYKILVNFVVKQAKFSANEFMWNHGVNDENIKVRITNFPKWSMVAANYWSGTIELTEV